MAVEMILQMNNRLVRHIDRCNSHMCHRTSTGLEIRLAPADRSRTPLTDSCRCKVSERLVEQEEQHLSVDQYRKMFDLNCQYFDKHNCSPHCIE